jgi:hypothetical protein
MVTLISAAIVAIMIAQAIKVNGKINMSNK